MSISNIERNIRFSNLMPDDYKALTEHYRVELIKSLQNDSNFIAIYESTNKYVRPKADLKREGEKLAKHDDPTIARFGKAVVKFIAKGAQVFDELCLAISAVLLVGGFALATCITLILGIIVFALLTIPITIVVAGLASIDNALNKVTGKNKDPNVIKFEKLSKNIQSQKNGVKDVKGLEKAIKVSEALDLVLESPEIKIPDDSREIIHLLEVLKVKESTSNHIISEKMEIYENLCPDYLCYNINDSKPMLESLYFEDGTDLFMSLESINSKPLLSGRGLLNGLIAITTNNDTERTVLEFLNRYKNTVDYEMKNDNYNDLPILMETGYCLKFIRESCYDVPEVLSNCNRLDRLLGEIITECETENVSEDASSFNPDPFSIGSLTPFPVADRAVSDALCDIENAETDDEMLEALINFGRISKVINESYYVMECEDGSEVIVQEDLGKVARKAETKANKKFAKKAEKDKSKGVKSAVKHTTDPMVKFVENKYNKLKEADAEERKRIVMQGGAATGTIYKIWRWVKRSIPLIIGGVVGQYVPVVAIITGISLIGMIASDKSLDKRERAKIMRELEDEIKIVNEKIEDARGDDNKQKRYELMRIRNNLERQRDRIRYNLKY